MASRLANSTQFSIKQIANIYLTPSVIYSSSSKADIVR